MESLSVRMVKTGEFVSPNGENSQFIELFCDYSFNVLHGRMVLTQLLHN